MAAVTSDLKARERSAELRQLVGKKYRYIDRKWDVMFWVTAAFVVGAAADITKLLFAGDWDFWTDWKDAQWWPIITPFAIIIIPSALQYIQWPTCRGSSTCAARPPSTCGWSSRARCGPSSARRCTCRWCSAPR